MLNWYFIASLVIIALVGFCGFDNFLLRKIEEMRRGFSPAVLHFFRAVSFTPFVIVVLFVAPAIAVAISLDIFSFAALALACLLATGSAFILKYIFRRVRPLGHKTYLGKIDSAFPSAHTAGSFAAAFTLAYFWPSYAPLFFAFATLVALSRMYLELHFFSDIAGGILLAYLLVVFTLDSQIFILLGFE